MKRDTLGWMLWIGGMIGLFVVYTLRPPAGIGDAFNMMLSGKQRYIREPVYSWLLVTCFAVSVVGAALLLRDLMKKGNKGE